MPALHFPLAAHHAAELGIPLAHGLRFGGSNVETRQMGSTEAVDVAMEEAENLFHLPHIKQIFRTIVVAELLGNNHI